MEALWMVAGAALGAGVVYAVAFNRPRTGAGPEIERLGARVQTLAADVDRLRLDFSDLLDRVGHLYDRIRKRLQLQPEVERATGNGEPVLVGKAAIRARARVGGLLK